MVLLGICDVVILSIVSSCVCFFFRNVSTIGYLLDVTLSITTGYHVYRITLGKG